MSEDELVESLADLVREERRLAEEVAAAEAKHRAIRQVIQEEMAMAKQEKIVTAGYTVSMVRPKASEKLDKGRLVAAGVTPAQLEAGTVVTPRNPYVTVRKVPDLVGSEE